MPTHWTYDAYDDAADLSQGDVIARSDELLAIFREVHPHFCDEKYIAFLLMTQCCDLVRSGGDRTKRYLNIAVVRQLEDVLHDLLTHVCKTVAPRIYTRESKDKANLLLERLFNQNEQGLGLFYLHPDADAGIAVPSVALLRVAVTLRVEHYEALKKSRCGRLSQEFRAKLGWLVGNLYSRVGTQDWTEPPSRKRELKQLMKDVLDPSDSGVAPHWVSDSWVKAAQEKGVAVDDLPTEQLLAEFDKHKPTPAKESVIDRAAEIVREVVTDVSEGQLQTLRKRMANDSLFARAIRSVKSE